MQMERTTLLCFPRFGSCEGRVTCIARSCGGISSSLTSSSYIRVVFKVIVIALNICNPFPGLLESPRSPCSDPSPHSLILSVRSFLGESVPLTAKNVTIPMITIVQEISSKRSLPPPPPLRRPPNPFRILNHCHGPSTKKTLTKPSIPRDASPLTKCSSHDPSSSSN